MIKTIFFKKIILFTILIFLVISLLFSNSCKNISSPFDLNSFLKNSSSSSLKNTTDNIEDRELFFKLKNSQKDRNPLSNINIRKAIFYGIDRQKIVNELYGDNNNVLNSMFNSSSFFYNPVWSEYSYNLEKAKDFLSKAGYSTENPLFLTIVATDNSPSRIKIENIIKENLDQIGIKLWIDNKPPNELYINTVKKGDFELGVWSLYTFSPDDLNNYLSSSKIPVNETGENKNCNNFYWYKNDETDLLLKNIKETENINEQKNYADSIQKIVSENAIILPLFSRLFAAACKEKINNVEISSIDGNFFKNIENWSLKNETGNQSFEIIAGMSAEPNTLNPFLEENTSMNYINSLILKGLWTLNENSSYQPELVIEENLNSEVNTRNLNAKKIILKDNIYWEDGSPIIASDVKATIDAIKNDKSISRFKNDFDKINKIEVVNEKELTVYFKENIKDWKKLFLYIFPEKDLKKDKLSNLYMYDIFGNGPYKLKEWKKGEYILLTLNNNYFGKKPLVSDIKIIFNNNEKLLIDSLKKGDIDILSIPVDLNTIEEIKSDKKLNLILKEGNLWEQLAVCLKKKE
ncbi:MAG: ABC transporter substrate-binding protein [Actinobacteria bacterium]|nr:ABC transporter substrate-binding protein [Actinomycetota bacterium]